MATKKSRKPAAKKKPAARKLTRRVAAKKKPAATRKLATKASARKPAARKAAARKTPARKTAARKTARKPLARAATKRMTPPSPPQDGRPAASPALFPYLTVRDAEDSLVFYQKAFGFQPHGPALCDRDGRVMHASMRLNDAVIMFGPEHAANTMRAPASSGAPDSLSLYVYVPDVDAVTERAERGGAKVLQTPVDQFWGDRIAIFKDPDGYHWTFATNVADFDPAKVPF